MIPFLIFFLRRFHLNCSAIRGGSVVWATKHEREPGNHKNSRRGMGKSETSRKKTRSSLTQTFNTKPDREQLGTILAVGRNQAIAHRAPLGWKPPRTRRRR